MEEKYRLSSGDGINVLGTLDLLSTDLNEVASVLVTVVIEHSSSLLIPCT